MTFANGLRSILRHDPQVIMVEEVRPLFTNLNSPNIFYPKNNPF